MKRIYMNEVDESGSEGAAAERTTAAIRPDLTNYQTVKSATGSSTKICGDAVSVALVGATLDETYGFVSKVVGITEDVLRGKYGASNVGQQRMFLGNLIRGGMGGKDTAKAERITTAFSENVGEFRTGLDARLAESARVAEEEKAAKAAAAQKVKDDLKAEKDAKAAKAKQEKEDKAKADKEAKESAAANPKTPKAPKEPAQPK